MSYKTELQSNNSDLQAILDTVNALPEGGGAKIATGTFTMDAMNGATVSGLGFAPTYCFARYSGQSVAISGMSTVSFFVEGGDTQAGLAYNPNVSQLQVGITSNGALTLNSDGFTISKGMMAQFVAGTWNYFAIQQS